MSEKHFTAVVEVFEMTASGTITTPTRDKQEVARIIVRAESLDKLQKKLINHVALIEN